MRACNPNESSWTESIRNFNPNESGQSEWMSSIRINPNDSEKLDFDQIDRIHSDCKFRLILINSDWPDSFGLQVRIEIHSEPFRN